MATPGEGVVPPGEEPPDGGGSGQEAATSSGSSAPPALVAEPVLVAVNPSEVAAELSGQASPVNVPLAASGQADEAQFEKCPGGGMRRIAAVKRPVDQSTFLHCLRKCI